MIIIYLTDIHGAFDRVGQLLDATTADAYIIGGDLIDLPFYTMNTAIHYHDLQSYFHGLRRRSDKTNLMLEDFVDRLLLTPDLPEEIHEKGARFQQYTIRARRVMQQKYKMLENILCLKPELTCYCLPGNYDMDLKYTSLHHRDLHIESRSVGRLTLAGFGGAGGWTQGIPERYVVHSRSGRLHSERDREMTRFFEAARPDIIVTHQPAHGFHDQVTPMGETGSAALLHYCETHDVLACLTGHIHEQWGFAESEGTIYLNPSNFGDVYQVSGRISEGGFFHEIEISSNRIESVLYRKIFGGSLHDIMIHERGKDGWRSHVMDPERYGAHLRGHAFDQPPHPDRPGAFPDWHKEAQNLYRKPHPDPLNIKKDPAEEALKLFHDGNPLPFALDIVGTAGDSRVQSESELDLVVYLRCGRSDDQKACFAGSTSECPHFQTAQSLIRNRMGERLDFQITDCIDLNHVENSIRGRHYECEMTQRFVLFRSFGRPVRADLLAQTEALLGADSEFRQELDGSISTYFRIFLTTARRIGSLGQYESHLKQMGIRLPGSLRIRIHNYLKRKHTLDRTQEENTT